LPSIEHVAVDGGAAVALVSRYEEGQPLACVTSRAALRSEPMPAAVAIAITLDLIAALDSLGGQLAPGWSRGAAWSRRCSRRLAASSGADA
jgi:hypothetical protein